MPADMSTTFEVLAQPVRRAILGRLRHGEHLVGELADALGATVRSPEHPWGPAIQLVP